jgi:hypothetical protein
LQNLPLFCSLSFVFGFVGLHPASAQLGPPAAPQVPSSGALSSANGNHTAPTTRVVRIYNGAGFFDDALAEKLRPLLAKAFPSSVPEPVQPVSGATGAAQVKPETPKKIAEAAHQ